MPVGTKGTVKALAPSELEDLGVEIILGNTYHLHLRPGEEVVQQLGGLHRFMGWRGPILTDSGGFQVFSLRDTLLAVDEDGVTFRSVYDGIAERLTPERAMAIQTALGSDIAMAFDECPPGGAERAVVERAVERTATWAERSVAAPAAPGQLRFGIVQGGVDPELRRARRAADHLAPVRRVRPRRPLRGRGSRAHVRDHGAERRRSCRRRDRATSWASATRRACFA